MKKLMIVLMSSLIVFSCLSTGNLLDEVVDTAVEKTVVAVVEETAPETSDPVEQAEPVEVVEPVEQAEPLAPVKLIPTEAEIVDAVKAYDLDGLTELLADIDDVKTIVGEDVLLLHMAEDAMGLTGEKNEMLALLVEKKAYILQLDEKGKSFDRFVMKMEMAGTPRHEFIMEVLGDKFQTRIEALRSDNLEVIIAMTEYFPVNAYLLRSAVDEKAAKVASWVIDQGVAVDGIDSKTGEGLLHLACNGKPYDFAFDQRIDLVRALLDAGADVNQKDNKGDTPIARLFMVPQGKLGSLNHLTEVLLEAGADVNTVTSKNLSLLNHAARMRYDDLVSLLVDEGAVIDDNTLNDMNLTLAVMNRFLEEGADPAAFADNLSSISDPEAQLKFIIKLLAKGAAATDFDIAIVRNNFEALSYLVDQGADINSSNILMACITDFKGMERIEYLVEHGADLAKKYYNDLTALHFAVKSKKNEVAAYLIMQGADLNPVDSKGNTPLDYCDSRNQSLLTQLVEAGAKKASEL